MLKVKVKYFDLFWIFIKFVVIKSLAHILGWLYCKRKQHDPIYRIVVIDSVRYEMEKCRMCGEILNVEKQ